MRQLAGLLAFCVLMVGLAVPVAVVGEDRYVTGATEAGDLTAKWEVTIHIKYNAVEWAKVEELVRQMQGHAGACEAKLTVRKPDNSSNYIILEGATGEVTLTPLGTGD